MLFNFQSLKKSYYFVRDKIFIGSVLKFKNKQKNSNFTFSMFILILHYNNKMIKQNYRCQIKVESQIISLYK